MYWNYELACKEAGMSEEEIKNYRKIFDSGKKDLKHKDRIIEEMQYTRINLDSAVYDDDQEGPFDIPDENCNVEEAAIWNVNMEKLIRCLDLISPDEKELILAFYDKSVSITQYAKAKGLSRQKVYRIHDKVLNKLKAMMGM